MRWLHLEGDTLADLLRPGAAGEIQLQAKNPTDVRCGKPEAIVVASASANLRVARPDRNGRTNAASVQEQLRLALSTNWRAFINLVEEEMELKKISASPFRQALRSFGLS